MVKVVDGKPDFLKNAPDEEETTSSPLDVLKDEEEKETPEEQELQEENQETEKEKQEEIKEEEKGKEETKEEEEKKEEEKEEESEEEIEKEEEAEEKEEEVKEDERELLEKHGLGKFKNLEDFFKSYKELQRKFTQITQSLPEKIKQTQMESKYPLVKPPIPKIEDYYYEDEEGNTRVDFDAYMRDYTNSLIVSLQQSLLQGPLAARLFSVMSQALNERFMQSIEEEEALKKSEVFLSTLQEKYPVLKKDEKMLERLIAYIYGQAQLKGKEMDLEEALELADDFMAGRAKEERKEEEAKTETQPATPQISEKKEKGPLDDIREDIEEMLRLKRQRSIF